MRNPDKESKKAPSLQKTFSIDDETRKRERTKHFISVLLLLLCIVLFLLMGGGTETEDAADEKGLNTETPQTGSVRVGRTKRENVEIAGEYDRREADRNKVSHSSFDWYYNEESKADDGKTEKSGGRNDKERLAEAVERSEAIVQDVGRDGGRERAASTKTQSGGGSQASRSASDEYVARREAEVRRQQDEQIKRIEAAANAQSGAGGKKEVKKKKEPEGPVAEVDKKEVQKGFFGIDGVAKSKSDNIRAVVHGEHKNLHSGATVKMRLLDNIKLGEWRVPKNTFVYGVLSFSKGRAQITIENINLEDNIIPFKGTIYDKDGFEGIYVPDNVVDDAKRKAGGDAISSLDVNVSSASSLINSGVNAVTGAVKSAVSGSVREEKITISTNYQLTIKQKRE